MQSNAEDLSRILVSKNSELLLTALIMFVDVGEREAHCRS